MSAVRAIMTLLVFVAFVCGCARSGERITRAVELRDIAPQRGSGVVFVDAMKQATRWSSKGPLLFDHVGNVRLLAPGQVAETVMYRGESYPAGVYTLLYDGKGAFDFSHTGGTVVARAPGRVLLRIVPCSAGIRLRLTATDLDQPPRNIRLILPGFEKTYASAPFHPLFIERLRSFNVLDFKDWMHADTFVSSAIWPERPQMTQATQVAPAGVAPEYMVGLANATGADPWFTLPVGATDMYIYQFAALVHHTLDPRLHATFEYGHDAWKPRTPSNAYAAMAGRNFHLAADPAAAARDWYALRSKQMFAIVQRAFGSDAERVHLADGPLTGARLRELSRAALEGSHVASVSPVSYMPPAPTLPTAAPRPPIPLAPECLRSPQCVRVSRLDRNSQRISPGLQRRRRMTSDTEQRPLDYRI